jgi:hypothetical protein
MKDGFAGCSVEPAAARFDQKLGEFLLPYEAVRTSADPQEDLTSFLQSTYDAAADLSEWDRQALECDLGIPRIPTGHAVAHHNPSPKISVEVSLLPSLVLEGPHGRADF